MIFKLKDNRVGRTYLGGSHISLFCNGLKEENNFFPEDWTASVVTAFGTDGGDNVGLGYTVGGTSVK